MNSILTNLEQIIADAVTVVGQANDFYTLEQIRSRYLGKKGQLTVMLKSISAFTPQERPQVGQAINRAKEKIINVIAVKCQALQTAAVTDSLSQEAIDITLPSRGQKLGTIHPVTKVQKIFEGFFTAMGFSVIEGPEIENEFYNFTALNTPPHHPSRTMHDTFYFADGLMLRSQTSPVQVRAMQKMQPPLRIICPGKVFRRDSDATHAPMFHQLEMLLIDENVNFANLKWLINKFIEFFFAKKVEYRFRPSYFPFTTPSAEVDIKWRVGGSWQWLELGGCGVVHPNVLRAGKINPKRFSGLAFGFGIDRLAMSYYGVKDIRMLFENDLQFLQQF